MSYEIKVPGRDIAGSKSFPLVRSGLALSASTHPAMPLELAGHGMADNRRLTQFPVRTTKQSRSVAARRRVGQRAGFGSNERTILS